MRIPCNKCGGTGRVPLAPEHGRTLDLLRRFGPATVLGLIEHTSEDISVPCLNNRLARLRSLGLATSSGSKNTGQVWSAAEVEADDALPRTHLSGLSRRDEMAAIILGGMSISADIPHDVKVRAALDQTDLLIRMLDETAEVVA